jgi:hypothetical protein
MSASPSRRTFLQASTGAAAVGLTGLPFLDRLRPVSAAEARLDPNLVRVDSGIEPLVRLLEETPRNKVLEEVADRVKKGLGYQDLLAALFLAGVRNVQPRPSVGFKFHAVLVVNSAHLASLAGPDRERWLPIFWAVDNFKSAQAQTQKESGWRMRPVDEMKLPRQSEARSAFIRAMEAWDEEAADAAVAVLARTAPVDDLFNLFARFGCRDFRDIGHKAIFVASAFRTLEAIGWHHAEPVLRSLTYALMHHEGENPAKRDGEPDRPGRRNAAQTEGRIAEWEHGKPDPAATTAYLEVLREAGEGESATAALKLLQQDGISPRSVWDGLFLGAGELLMRQPGIVGLHTLTTVNALHYAFRRTGDDATRLLLTLQAASFLPLFREAMKGRGKVGDARIDRLEPAHQSVDADAVFAELSRDRVSAARLAMSYMKSDDSASKHLIDAGRRLVFLKGSDSHDYKFSSAVLEDHANISPPFRDRFLAAGLFWLKGSAGADAPIVKRVRAALA